MGDIVQRWRVVYRRGHRVGDLAQRDELEAWESAVTASGLPIATSGATRSRPRLGSPPPLPAGLRGDRELIDLHLLERCRSAEVRARLAGVMPVDHELIDLHDVWVGAIPLAAAVISADFELRVIGAECGELSDAADALLARPNLPRVRRRGERRTPYDLRPFLLGLVVDDLRNDAVPRLWMRLAVHPEQGAGRPDEVVFALAEGSGRPLEPVDGARTRIWTLDDQPNDTDPA